MMQNVKVRHILTTAVLSIDVAQPITAAIHLFATHPVHHLPVVDGTVLKGMLSTADLLKLEYFLPKSGPPAAALLNERFKIDKLMRSPVLTAGLEDSMTDAASRMMEHAVHALPVVDESNRLLGILTTTDIMQALLHGIGLGKSADSPAGNSRPSELLMRRAVEAASSAITRGTDPDGIAASMLYLNERNILLETLRVDVTRYLRSGQDERLHSKLLKDLGQLEQRAIHPGDLSVPL